MKNTPLSKKEAAAFIKRLRNLKKELGVKTDSELATFLDVPRSTLKEWFDRKAVPSAERVEKIETYLQERLLTLDKEIHAISNYVSHLLPAC